MAQDMTAAIYKPILTGGILAGTTFILGISYISQALKFGCCWCF